jgi:hypothetical protein
MAFNAPTYAKVRRAPVACPDRIGMKSPACNGSNEQRNEQVNSVAHHAAGAWAHRSAGRSRGVGSILCRRNTPGGPERCRPRRGAMLAAGALVAELPQSSCRIGRRGLSARDQARPGTCAASKVSARGCGRSTASNRRRDLRVASIPRASKRAHPQAAS